MNERDIVSKDNMSLLPVARTCDPYSERFAAGEYLDRILSHNIDGISDVPHLHIDLTQEQPCILVGVLRMTPKAFRVGI